MLDINNELNEFRLYLSKYVNKSCKSLEEELNVQTKAKSKNYIISKQIADNYKGKKFYSVLSEHEKIMIKTIQLKENGFPKESMSFTPINYQKIVKETWNSSELFNIFSNTFLFFIFKFVNGENILYKISFWKMPIFDLDGEVKQVWIETKNKIINGEIIKSKNERGQYITHFLHEKDTNICHIRPHGTNSSDVIPLPTPDQLTGYSVMTKHSFWLNHLYVKKIVELSDNV